MINQLKDKIRQRLISDYSSLLQRDSVNVEELKQAITYIFNDITRSGKEYFSEEDKNKIVADVLDEVLGYGPIEDLFKDNSVTEIMINGPKRVFVEREGKKILSNVTFDNERQLMHVIHKILAPTRRRVDESYPYTEVSLGDGSRVNIVIPPVALDGPIVTIRKFSREIKRAEDLVELGTLDKRMAGLLVAAIKVRLNIIFVGATGSGKTTTLNVLSSYISSSERIVTIEDTAELRLNQEHVARLETRQPNIEGRGEITIRELFKNSLRMRPDRIILGEIRGAEALDMLQAICSGHTGSLSVLHASSPRDAVYRIETMILTSGVPISMEAIHRQIIAAVNLIVQHEQLTDGSRKITYITQVNGRKENDIILEDIFVFDMEDISSDGKIKGRWRATGVVPVFYPLFKKHGIDLPIDIFTKDQ